MLYVKYLGRGKGPVLLTPALSRQYDFTSGAAVMADKDALLLVARCCTNYKIEENPNSDQRAMIVAATEEQVPATEEQVPATEEQVAATEEQVAATEEQVTATEEQVAATEEQVAATAAPKAAKTFGSRTKEK